MLQRLSPLCSFLLYIVPTRSFVYMFLMSRCERLQSANLFNNTYNPVTFTTLMSHNKTSFATIVLHSEFQQHHIILNDNIMLRQIVL